jgi:hypothetical protein
MQAQKYGNSSKNCENPIIYIIRFMIKLPRIPIKKPDIIPKNHKTSIYHHIPEVSKRIDATNICPAL